jgi:hypothetical protein
MRSPLTPRARSEASVRACVRTSAASKSASVSSGAAPRCRVPIIVLSLAFSDRSTTEGLSYGVSILQMIKPLLEGFDPARRPLLFYVEFRPITLVRDGASSTSKSGKVGYIGISIARTLPIGENSSISWLLRRCTPPRVP